jgi:hypothetical protein
MVLFNGFTACISNDNAGEKWAKKWARYMLAHRNHNVKQGRSPPSAAGPSARMPALRYCRFMSTATREG